MRQTPLEQNQNIKMIQAHFLLLIHYHNSHKNIVYTITHPKFYLGISNALIKRHGFHVYSCKLNSKIGTN